MSRPNPVEADEVALRMGAGALETVGLGNLAAGRLDAESGAAGGGARPLRRARGPVRTLAEGSVVTLRASVALGGLQLRTAAGT